MNNKKGDFMLGEYTLKMIIAVLCIILLLYLLFSIYSSFTNQKSIEKAEATLSSFVEKMNDAKTKVTTLPLLEPNSWLLIGYNGNQKPIKCLKNCICLCPERGYGDMVKGTDQIDKCDLSGVCRDIENKFNTFNITVNRQDVNIEYKDGGYLISEKK